MTVDSTGNPPSPARRWRSYRVTAEQAGHNPAYRVSPEHPLVEARLASSFLPERTVMSNTNTAAAVAPIAEVTNAQLLAELQATNAMLASLRSNNAALGVTPKPVADGSVAAATAEASRENKMSTFGKVALGTLGAGALAVAGYFGYQWYAGE